MIATVTTDGIASGKRDDFLKGVPGVYAGIPFREYAASNAINASLLKEVVKSPAHALDYMQRVQEPKRHFAFGNASHTWLLEPHMFHDSVCVAGQCAALKKSGERCSNTGLTRCDGRWYCGVKGHLPGESDDVQETVVTEDEFAQMQLASEALCAHDGAMQLLTSDGFNELTVLVPHEATGLLLKARLDIYRPQFQLIGDIKTARCVEQRVFASDMAKNGYDIQAAFYTNVARMAGLQADHFGVIAIEKTRPFLPDAFRLVDEVIEAGWHCCERLLQTVAHCQESGEWPGYSNEFRDIDVPAWRYDVLYGGEEI